jgi:sugar lactone lactonase YvrE
MVQPQIKIQFCSNNSRQAIACTPTDCPQIPPTTGFLSMRLSRQVSLSLLGSLTIAISLSWGLLSTSNQSLYAKEPTGELAAKLAGVKFDQYAAAPGYSEGPSWIEGDVYFCSGALLRVDAAKKVHPVLNIEPAGTVVCADGRLLICDNKNKALLSLSPEGQLDVVVERFETHALRSLNDLTIDACGNVYWTDPESSSPENLVGNVFRVRPDGRVDRIATGLAFPNGVEVDPQSKHLYVIESQTKKILRYALPTDDELLGEAELFYDLGGSGGDGCAFDAAGNLWVADFHRPETGKGRITVLSPQAEVLAYLPLPTKLVSNIAFGGPNHDEIFCTTGDAPGVFHTAVGVKGFVGHPGKPLPVVRTLNVVAQKPHPDAEAVQKLVATAASADVSSGKFSAATLAELNSQLAALSDTQLRSDLEKLLPAMERAAVRHAGDRPLLNEIERLHGIATLEVRAPEWLRAIAGDEALELFGRIVEINLNERTNGHIKAEPKPISERTNNETLKLLAGQDALRQLELSGTAVTSAGLIHLRGLTAMQALNLCLTEVDDSGFEYLAGMVDMKRMTVCASKITGSGFKHLGSMKKIESINHHSSPASDEGLEAIAKLTTLKRLEKVHTNLTDNGLIHLSSLVNLRQFHVDGHDATENALPFIGQLKELYELDIYNRPASNQTLAEIGKLPKLRFLRFFNGHFDDVGVKHLASLGTLEELVLHCNGVTDASIESLGQLKRLRVLQLAGTKVTDEGKARLKEMLPKLEIK